MNQKLLTVSLTNNLGVKPSTVFLRRMVEEEVGQSGKILS